MEEKKAFVFFNIFVVILSIYVILSLIIETLFHLPTEISRLINLLDNLICIIFFFDFSIRFYNSEDKLKFMRWGWIDLISSIPSFEYLRFGRAVRLIKIFRLLRVFRSTKYLINYVFSKKAHGALTSAFIISILMIIVSSIAILYVEDAADSNIKTAEDAIWWSYVTITTVGYGDKFPVTTEGRIIAAILMTVGVGMFGTFTAYVASWFMSGNNND